MINSETGNASQIPGIFSQWERMMTQGMIRANPRVMETAKAGIGCSVALNIVEVIILIPTKGNAKKYRKVPCFAILKSVELPVLSKILITS